MRAPTHIRGKSSENINCSSQRYYHVGANKNDSKICYYMLPGNLYSYTPITLSNGYLDNAHLYHHHYYYYYYCIFFFFLGNNRSGRISQSIPVSFLKLFIPRYTSS